MRLLNSQNLIGFPPRRGTSQDKHTSSRNRCRPLRRETLESRTLLSGVTLITHGFNSSVDDWVTAMADAIAARPDLSSDQPRYRVDVTDPGHDGGPLSVVNTSHSGPTPAESSGATDIVILLNWTDVAGTLSLGGGYHRSTGDVAAAVAEKLLAPNFLTALATPLAELPFHLIGHSRGASLVGELAKKLGEAGVWVDQVTTLDPHPVDGVREPWLFNYDFGDVPMTSWENVAFWDNYWRTDGSNSLDFTGESMTNVYDLQLSESVLSNGGYSYEHSDVHLWYHGTIDTSPTANDGSYTVPTGWYGSGQPERDATGFYYSTLVGGPRPAAGLSAELGGAANRTAIDRSNATWPNVLELSVSGDTLQFMQGEPIPVAYYYQDYDSAATISFSLDQDQNPYSQNALDEGNRNVAQTGAALVQNGDSLNTGDVPLGQYYLAAKITDASGHTRYAYSREPVTIAMPVPTTRVWGGGGTDNKWSTAANWLGGIAPLPGDNLVFPADAIQQENVNDYSAGTVFGSITVLGGGYLVHDGIFSSSNVELPAGTLAAASIVCDTLTVGSASGIADSSYKEPVQGTASPENFPRAPTSSEIPRDRLDGEPTANLAGALRQSSFTADPPEKLPPIAEKAIATKALATNDQSDFHSPAENRAEGVNSGDYTGSGLTILGKSAAPLVTTASPRSVATAFEHSPPQSPAGWMPASQAFFSSILEDGLPNQFFEQKFDDAKKQTNPLFTHDGQSRQIEGLFGDDDFSQSRMVAQGNRFRFDRLGIPEGEMNRLRIDFSFLGETADHQ